MKMTILFCTRFCESGILEGLRWSLTSMASAGLKDPLPRFPPCLMHLGLFLSLWGAPSSGVSSYHMAVWGSSHFFVRASACGSHGPTETHTEAGSRSAVNYWSERPQDLLSVKVGATEARSQLRRACGRTRCGAVLGKYGLLQWAR